jgi:molybdopterin converting factor small subunit
MAKLMPHYSLAKAIGCFEVDIAAKNVAELLDEGRKRFGEVFDREMKLAAIMVNGRNILYLKGFKTKLASDDEVMTVIPSAGG